MAVKKKSPSKKIDRQATVESVAESASKATGKKFIPGWATKKRIEQVTKDVDIKLTGEPIPLAREPGRGQIGGLREYPIEGSTYSLLAMEDPMAIPTLEQRRMMARRIIEVGPKLPRYIQYVKMAPHMFHSKNDPENSGHSEAKAKEETEGVAVGRTARVKKMIEAGDNAKAKPGGITGGIPLKKICANVSIDPKIARRILRAKGGKPGGRWEWTPDEAKKIEETLKAEYEKLKKAGKV